MSAVHDKVDRGRLLAESGSPTPESRESADAPASPSAVRPAAPASGSTGTTIGDLEAQVAELWTAVLGTKHVGLDDNFFDCGGNSRKLISLHARLCRTFGVELPLQRLFEISTVRAIARYLQAPDAENTASQGSARPASGVETRGVEASGVETRGAARRNLIESRKDRR